MAVIDLVPWSRRLHVRRLVPVVVAILLLLVVLAAFLFIPPADVDAAAAEAAHASAPASYPATPDGTAGEHLCPEA